MSNPADRDPTDAVRSVRALAHPLRLRLLDELRFEGPATATLLAQRVGESTGATSYHLRQLARHGYVEDAEPRGGKERWWRYRERRVAVDPGGSRNLLAELLTREAHALDRYLAAPPQPAEWDEAAFFRSAALRLTPGELDALRRGIADLLAPLRRADADDAPAGALPVRILAFGFPVAPEDA
jgi:DNA-binding transcriptional ArsR family regulator